MKIWRIYSLNPRSPRDPRRRNILNTERSIILGVDSGATKIEVAVVDLEGRLLNLIREESSGNPASIGFERFTENISRALEKTLERFQGYRVVGLGIGLAGFLEGFWNESIRKILSRILGEDLRIIIVEDIHASHISAHLFGDGVIGVLGTGSNFYGVCRGRSWRVGGWGHLVDDRGGAYSIGVQALSKIFRSIDGRADHTILLEYALKHYNASNIHELIYRIYSSPDPKSLIASFAPKVFKAFLEEDPAAVEIIRSEVREISLAIATIMKKIQCLNIPTALTGSVYKENRSLLKKLVEEDLSMRFNISIDIKDQIIRESCASALIILREITRRSFEEKLENIIRSCAQNPVS
ncbi:MAG: BadF/BadG/BcrA/BcrD ATPase family protein [Sulfolobales archaeon]